MAFNWKTFQTRTLTAVIFAAVMLTGLLWNQWSFFILFAIIHFGCWWEYFNLLEKIHNTTYHHYMRVGFMLMGFAIMLWFCGPEFQINNHGLKESLAFPISVAGFVMLTLGIFQTKSIKPKALGTAALGLIYISLCWGLMLSLFFSQITESIQILPFPNHPVETVYDVEKPWLIPLVLISSIWISDTMAYIVGSVIGKTPLSKISSKKTWEGTIGGVILGTVVTGVIFSNVNTDKIIDKLYGDEEWYIIATIASIFGTLGDLLESKLKRMAEVKDSGNIMPGHGGFLDRFDSMLLAIPAVWLYIALFMVVKP